LAEAMMASHYPLQALLYSVALHRFLRWRVSGYDPAHHLGGIAYLFVRGMAGPTTPMIDGQPCGVFAWRPTADLIVDLDHLLAGRPS
jgi:exodeoxyribonuclease V beta subunit